MAKKNYLAYFDCGVVVGARQVDLLIFTHTLFIYISLGLQRIVKKMKNIQLTIAPWVKMPR